MPFNTTSALLESSRFDVHLTYASKAMKHSLLSCHPNRTLRLLSNARLPEIFFSKLAQSKIKLNWLEIRAILEIQTHYSDGSSFRFYRLHEKINMKIILIEFLFSHL